MSAYRRSPCVVGAGMPGPARRPSAQVDDGLVDERAVEWVCSEGLRLMLRPHERQIAAARMDAAGLADSEIAARLLVTERTVQRMLHGRREGVRCG